MVTSLIEGRRISMEELLNMLKRSMRQRSMYRTSRIEFLVYCLLRLIDKNKIELAQECLNRMRFRSSKYIPLDVDGLEPEPQSFLEVPK